MSYRSHDGFFRKAKREGYRSRAAYKLLEINQRFRRHPGGPRGGGPGRGARRVASGGGRACRAARAGARASTSKPMQPLARKARATLSSWTCSLRTMRRSAFAPLAEGTVDCVLSDMAPRLSGIRDADHQRALELTRKAFDVARAVLKPRGAFLFKTFTGVSKWRRPCPEGDGRLLSDRAAGSVRGHAQGIVGDLRGGQGLQRRPVVSVLSHRSIPRSRSWRGSAAGPRRCRGVPRCGRRGVAWGWSAPPARGGRAPWGPRASTPASGSRRVRR